MLIIAGPNGAGKTTFAMEFLPKEDTMYRKELFVDDSIRSIVDGWVLYDNSGGKPVLIKQKDRV